MPLDTATVYSNPQDDLPVAPEHVRAMADYLKMFDDYRNTAEENRRQAAIDEDYYHGKQLTVAEKQVLSRRGQPDIVINRTRTAVNGIIGVIIRAKADPRCFPRTPADDNSADVATDVLRYTATKNRWLQTKATCFYDLLVPGIGAAMVTVNDDKEIIVDQIMNNQFFYDPRSRRRDFKDARYMGIAKWMYSSDVEALYPGQTISLAYSSAEGVGGAVDSTFEDRPRNQGAWLDNRSRRVMVIEVYHQHNGKWYRCVFYAGGVLEESISPYNDDKGRPCCPIEAMTGYIDSDNNRYGVVRDMRDIQDEVNKRRSKLLHLVNSHQIQARDPSAIEVDADVARQEAARPDGVIPYGWEVVRTTDMSAGQMQLLSEAKNEMERMGPNPAVLGRQGSDTSGRALLARQQAGLVELALVIDQLDDWETRIFHQCWYRAKQYWRAPQWIRVTDDQDAPKFVQLNAPKGQPVNDNYGQPSQHPEFGEDGEPHPQAGQMVRGEPAFDEAGDSIFGYDNDVGEMDVDIIVDTQPETANIMQEMVQDLIKLVAASPTYAEQVPFEIFIELSPLPHKRMVLDKLKAFKQEREASQAKQQQTQMAAAMAKLQAEIDEIHSIVFKNFATGEAALAKEGHEDAQAHIAIVNAETAAAEALHGAVGDHVDQQQNQQAMDQQAQQHAAEIQAQQEAAQAEPEVA